MRAVDHKRRCRACFHWWRSPVAMITVPAQTRVPKKWECALASVQWSPWHVGLILRAWYVPLPFPQDQERVRSLARRSMKQYFFLESRDHSLLGPPLEDLREGSNPGYKYKRISSVRPSSPSQPARMKDFPQELVDEVIDRLFDLVGRGNCYQGPSKRCRHRARHGISDYSLVSRAWVGSTQKHHFSCLYLDGSGTLGKWCARIAPDPDGVSRHVRGLVLDDIDLPDFEGLKEHLCALGQLKSLTVKDCDYALQFPSMEWFLPMRSSLVALRLSESSATSHTITSLLAVLPLLNRLEIYDFETPSDADEANPLTLSRAPLFEGAGCLTLCSYIRLGYPEGSLDWIPPSAWFAGLEIDMACAVRHPDLVNRWLASSRTTLTNLKIRRGPHGMSQPKHDTPIRHTDHISL